MSEFITLAEAEAMTSDYQALRTQLAPVEYPADVLPISETFQKRQLVDLLNQTGCESLRAYFAIDQEKNIRLVLVGVDADNNDILTDGSELILERGIRCPTICPASSPLIH